MSVSCRPFQDHGSNKLRQRHDLACYGHNILFVRIAPDQVVAVLLAYVQELRASVRKGRPIITVQVGPSDAPHIAYRGRVLIPSPMFIKVLSLPAADDTSLARQSPGLGYGENSSPIKAAGGKVPVLSPPPRSPTGRPARTGEAP